MRTILELNEYLSRERAWRVKEIDTVLKLASRAGPITVEREYYCRSGSAIFYAHWEGFAKRSAEAYLKFLAWQRVPISSAADFLLCLYATEKLKVGSPEMLRDFSRRLLDSPTSQIKISHKKHIDTMSNLSSTVYKGICNKIGVSFAPVETKLPLLDTLVLRNRNPIAHGSKGDVDLETLEKIGTLIIVLSASLKDEIENAANTKSYLRPAVAAPAAA